MVSNMFYVQLYWGFWAQPFWGLKPTSNMAETWYIIERGMDIPWGWQGNHVFFQKIVHELVSLYSQFLAGSGNPEGPDFLDVHLA